MANLSSQRVGIAQNSSSKLDVSMTHVTSGDFMHVSPVFYRHMLPKEHIKGHVQVNCRLSPMVVPTYGRSRINVRNFFVPFRCVFPNFNEFLADTIASNYSDSSLVSKSPTVLNSTFVSLFTDPTVSEVVGSINDSPLPAYDFCDISGRIYHLYRIGREMFRRVVSLGYVINFDSKDDFEFSALPLLCLAKVLYDWYTNSNYMDSSEVLAVERLLKYNDPTSNLVLSSTDLFNLLHFVEFVVYDGNGDYITHAWDNPVSPNPSNYSPLSMRDITLDSVSFQSPDQNQTFVRLSNSGTPFMRQVDGASDNIGTQYIHDVLQGLTNYMKRHQLSGARAADRLLAEYGVNIDSSKVDRSIFISTHSQDIQIGDVTSMANTSNTDVSNLGDFAGRGFSSGGLDFDFVADEFGIFISLLSIIPMGGLFQGNDRNNFHVFKTDFFTNELDNLGVQAIAKREVFVPLRERLTYANATDFDGIFGFAPRYAEYKVGRTAVFSGDLMLGSQVADGDSWHLFRKLRSSMFGGTISNLVHSLDFARGVDSPSYNRIFNDTTSENDKFYLVVATEASSLAPCKSLFDTYVFDDAKKSVLMHSSGAKTN